MSYWLQLAIADAKDAEVIFVECAGDFPQLTIDGITEPELAELSDLLGQRYSPKLAFSDEEGEVVISELPRGLAAALASLEPEQIDELAGRWHKSFADTNPKAGTPRDTRERLDMLSKFAVEAQKLGKPILCTQVL